MLNWWLRGCSSHADVSSRARCLHFGTVRAVPNAGFSMRGSRVGDRCYANLTDFLPSSNLKNNNKKKTLSKLDLLLQNFLDPRMVSLVEASGRLAIGPSVACMFQTCQKRVNNRGLCP